MVFSYSRHIIFERITLRATLTWLHTCARLAPVTHAPTPRTYVSPPNRYDMNEQETKTLRIAARGIDIFPKWNMVIGKSVSRFHFSWSRFCVISSCFWVLTLTLHWQLTNEVIINCRSIYYVTYSVYIPYRTKPSVRFGTASVLCRTIGPVSLGTNSIPVPHILVSSVQP